MMPVCAGYRLRHAVSVADQEVPERLPCPHGEERLLAAMLRRRRMRRGDSFGQHLLLCFDGSDGLASAAICQSLPNVAATLIVSRRSVGRTETLLEACGLSLRAHVIAGSPLRSPLQVAFDSIVVFESMIPASRYTPDVLETIASSLVPGGELCVVAEEGSSEIVHCRLGQIGLVRAEYSPLCLECDGTQAHFARAPSGTGG